MIDISPNSNTCKLVCDGDPQYFSQNVKSLNFLLFCFASTGYDQRVLMT